MPPTSDAFWPRSNLQKFSKEVVYGPNGKPLYAFYARDEAGNSGAAVSKEKDEEREQHAWESSSGLSETDKEIERKVLFKLLREEEEAGSQLRAQQLPRVAAQPPRPRAVHFERRRAPSR